MNNNINNTIVIIPWGSEQAMKLNVQDIVAAFNENHLLREYAEFSDSDKSDVKIAPPYVAEMYADLIRKMHKAPSSRNIFLNPRRADQAMVLQSSGEWTAICLRDASSQLLKEVNDSVGKVVLGPPEKDLPLNTMNAASIARMMYNNADPGEYIKRVKAPLMAHLANMTPVDALKKK